MGAVAWAMRQRSVSHPRSSNRTCGFPASGSPTGFVARHTEQITDRKRPVRGVLSSFASRYSFLITSLSAHRTACICARGRREICPPARTRGSARLRLPAAACISASTDWDGMEYSLRSLPPGASSSSPRQGNLGPVEVFLQNAGLTCDAVFRRMTPEQWTMAIDTSLTYTLQMPAVLKACGREHH
jgi:hypothetical protein